MIVNEVITGFVVIIIAYLLGSIPAAYIVTRLATGQDIRRLGSGNAGGNNVYRHVGLRAAIPVVIFDVGKGTTAVAIAHWLLEAPLFEPHLFVLLAGIAVVAGHTWSVYLEFSGGKRTECHNRCSSHHYALGTTNCHRFVTGTKSDYSQSCPIGKY